MSCLFHFQEIKREIIYDDICCTHSRFLFFFIFIYLLCWICWGFGHLDLFFRNLFEHFSFSHLYIHPFWKKMKIIVSSIMSEFAHQNRTKIWFSYILLLLYLLFLRLSSSSIMLWRECYSNKILILFLLFYFSSKHAL